MNSTSKKRFRLSILTGVVALSISVIFAGRLHGQVNQGLSTEGDPVVTGWEGISTEGDPILLGSQVGSRQSNEGALLGPVSEPPAPDGLEALAGIIGTTFEGFGFDDNATETGGGLFIPPDPMGAAGTDRVIGVVNVMIEARAKTGTLLWRDSLRDFFTTSTLALGTFTFDPKVIYDHYEDRFVVVTLEQTDTVDGDPSNESRILLAVSKTGTPAGPTSADWNYFAINSKINIGGVDRWADYPGFEVDEEAVYVTNNMFSFGAAPALGGVRLWIVDKGVVGGFYGGGLATFTVHDPYALAGFATTTMPCAVFGAGGVGPGIGSFLVSFSGITNGTDEAVQVVRVDDPLGAPTFTQEFVNVGNIDDVLVGLPDAPQSGTATPIEVNDRRALDCVWHDNRAWLTTTILPNAGPDVGETTAHWFKLNTSAVPAGTITLDDQGNIGGEDIAPDTVTFFPAVAVNSRGDATFGFSASAPTIFAGAFCSGREATNIPGTVQASQTVKAGEDFYIRTFGGGRNRWGDYSGISLDPVDESFWVFNEFADTRGTISSGEDGRWGTAWGNCAFTPPPPPVFCNGRPATLLGTNGNDNFAGTPGNDVIHGLAGKDTIAGLDGNDVICGGPGRDRLSGNAGRDRLFGGAGRDVLRGGSGNDRLFGQSGNDAMNGQSGIDRCKGGSGRDTAASCERTTSVP